MLTILRAVVTGLAIGLIAANVWPLLLLRLGMPAAVAGETAFLTLYILWMSGFGPPASWKQPRADAFRARMLTGKEWFWGLTAAIGFAVTVHAAIVVLFRLVEFPASAFHAGYDFSSIPGNAMRWIAVVISAASAGICEETGFRGYMQRPIEKQYGPVVAISISSVLFMLVHLTKSWSLIGMVPIVLGAGVLLGWLAFAARTLVFCVIGHTLMDVGLFAYWWTQIAGTFPQHPIWSTGPDWTFLIECVVLLLSLGVTLLATNRLRP